MRLKSNSSLVTLVALLTSACGTQENRNKSDTVDANEVTVSNLASNPEAQSQIIASQSADASEGAFQGETAESTSASLVESGEGDFKNLTRSCEIKSDGSAVVTISSEMERKRSIDRKKMSAEGVDMGPGKLVRTWKKEGATLECSKNGKHAAIDWANIQGVNADVEIERSRSRTMTLTNKKTNVTLSTSSSFSLKAKRSISWLEVTKTDSQIIRKKSITSTATRAMSYKNKAGETKSLEVSVATKEGAPLIVEIVRKIAAPHELVTKTIVSGTTESALKDGSKISSTYDNLKFDFDSKSCAVYSGGFSTSFLDSAGKETKKVTCTVSEGDMACADAAGVAIEIEAPMCDPEDAK